MTDDGDVKSTTKANVPLIIGVIIASLVGLAFNFFLLVLLLRWLKKVVKEK